MTERKNRENICILFSFFLLHFHISIWFVRSHLFGYPWFWRRRNIQFYYIDSSDSRWVYAVRSTVVYSEFLSFSRIENIYWKSKVKIIISENNFVHFFLFLIFHMKIWCYTNKTVQNSVKICVGWFVSCFLYNSPLVSNSSKRKYMYEERKIK